MAGPANEPSTAKVSLSDLDLEILAFFIGFFYLCLWWFRYIKMYLRHFLGVECTTQRYGEGTYAIVTGGIGGLGKAAVESFAQRGFNIVIISNNKQKMEQITASVKQVYPDIDVKCFEFDFGRQTKVEEYKDLCAKFDEIEISILFNNVCFADSGEYQDLSLDATHTMMTVNCYSLTLLSRLVSERFRSRWQNQFGTPECYRKRSLIINHCAGASLAPMPYVQMYSATKIFADHMTVGLGYELAEIGVDVMGIRSFGLSPELSKSKDEADEVENIGTMNGPPHFSLPADDVGEVNEHQQLSARQFLAFMNVSPEQCINASLSKCTSGLHFGALQHEIVGTMLTCVLDLIPFESRMLLTAQMGRKQVEDSKGIKL